MAEKENNQSKSNQPKERVTIPSDVLLDISLCLSDIPKEKMTKGRNDKIYINLAIGARKEADQWGRDLKVYVNQSKEEREAGTAKVYVGAGRTVKVAAPAVQQPSDKDLEDLPF